MNGRLIALGNRLKRLRESQGLSQQAVAKLVGTNQQQIGKLELGERELTLNWAERYGEAMGYTLLQLLEGTPDLTVPVLGYVGAGAEVELVDPYPKGGGLKQVRCPSGLNPAKIVAVIVRGDSQAPMVMDGWVVYYTRDPEPDTLSVLNKLCVVKIADGPVMLKLVKRGPRKFNLQSVNAPLIEDVALQWAAPVRAMLPPELAEASTEEPDPGVGAPSRPRPVGRRSRRS